MRRRPRPRLLPPDPLLQVLPAPVGWHMPHVPEMAVKGGEAARRPA